MKYKYTLLCTHISNKSRVQWNPSNLDTVGPEESVLISEVSCTQSMVLGKEEGVLFREVSL